MTAATGQRFITEERFRDQKLMCTKDFSPGGVQ